MTRKELDVLKGKLQQKDEKSSDLDKLVAAIMKLPYGQLKKVLSDEVMEVLAKYGYTA